jgi:Protein of unknown function (DUF2442)
MLNRIVRVAPLPHYRLEVAFEDGVSGIVDLAGDLDGEVFEPLRDEAFFRQVTIDEYGVPTWPNGADLAPDAIYLEITGGQRLERRQKLPPESPGVTRFLRKLPDKRERE